MIYKLFFVLTVYFLFMIGENDDLYSNYSSRMVRQYSFEMRSKQKVSANNHLRGNQPPIS
jgi:hypothetical protein